MRRTFARWPPVAGSFRLRYFDSTSRSSRYARRSSGLRGGGGDIGGLWCSSGTKVDLELGAGHQIDGGHMGAEWSTGGFLPSRWSPIIARILQHRALVSMPLRWTRSNSSNYCGVFLRARESRIYRGGSTKNSSSPYLLEFSLCPNKEPYIIYNCSPYCIHATLSSLPTIRASRLLRPIRGTLWGYDAAAAQNTGEGAKQQVSHVGLGIGVFQNSPHFSGQLCAQPNWFT